MPRINLSNSFVKKATCDKGKTFTEYYDKQVKAFGLRVYSTGSRAYFMRPTINGERFYRERADYEFPLGVDDAREWAIQTRRKLKQGQSIDEAEAPPKVDLSVEEFFTRYLAEYADIYKKSADADRRYVKIYINPAFKRRKIESLKSDDLQKLSNKITRDGTKYTTSNRVRSLFRKAWKWGQKFGYINPALPDPAQHVDKFHEESRDRYLTDLEIQRLFNVLSSEEPELYLAVELALATGLRKMETLSIEWTWIDFEQQEVRIPETKNKRPHTVALTDRITALLRDRHSVSVSRYVFPGRYDGDHRKDFKKSWKRVRKVARIPDVRWHDLRRTVGTRMAKGGVDLHTIAKALNHKSLASTQVYARLSTEDTRKAFDVADRKRGKNEQT